MSVARRSWEIVAIGLDLTIVSTAPAKYSGGTGEPNDPYQTATAQDLIALGETPEDYDKHFILTADLDLDPNLPGRGPFYDLGLDTPDPWWYMLETEHPGSSHRRPSSLSRQMNRRRANRSPTTLGVEDETCYQQEKYDE